ncbi:auxin-binding protein ABP19a isoform X2 [Vitis vinifera]|uniref:auxin-binding protein ABP19a isoform X2 n=1 Tax=Vitis vinifera TaxID=29760 RepID=UPI0008FF9B51|nr:auxin-binding protein ABP19a isoform X2 [Vitis vinifera]|eukprot:XP_019077691.1 PREDICTED: auxin-binding protein ABP19a isoform X2 [Vitis vinifera]
MLHILLLFSFLLSTSPAAAKDFCVADFKATQGLAGYQCKVPEEVVVDDLVYSGLNVAGNFSDIPKSAINAVFVDQLPGLNGLGLSMARLDLSLGGVIPMHSHPGGSEVKSGPVPALLWSSFSSSNPGQQVLSNALFSNNLASELIEKVTFLDELEVEKLKVLFGGSG